MPITLYNILELLIQHLIYIAKFDHIRTLNNSFTKHKNNNHNLVVMFFHPIEWKYGSQSILDGQIF